jgi:hypothetical protein
MGELEIFCCHSIIFTPTPLHSSYAQETIHLMWSCSAGDRKVDLECISLLARSLMSYDFSFFSKVHATGTG